MGKKSYLLFLGLMAVLLLGPLVFMERGVDVISPIDNAKLPELPRAGSEDLAYDDATSQVTSYFEKRIGFREEIVASYSTLNDKLFHVMVHPLYSYGKDGYVFGRSQFTPLEVPDEYLESFSSYVAEMQEYCESRGREFLFVINPNKAAVYPDYLPNGMHANHSVTVPLDPLLEEKKVSFLDLTDAMIDARARGEIPYNRMFDANHWNFVGAFNGVNAMIASLGDPKVPLLSLGDYTQGLEHKDTLEASAYPIDEDVPTLALKDSASRAIETDFSREGLRISESYNFFRQTENPERPDGTSVLIFRGSHFTYAGPLFENQFQSATMIHNYVNALDVVYYCNLFDPDIVIFEAADFTIDDSSWPMDTMEAAHFNAPYESYAALPEVALDGLGTCEVERHDSIADFSWPFDKEIAGDAFLLVDGKAYDLEASDSGLSVTLSNDAVRSIEAGARADVCIVDEDGGSRMVRDVSDEMR
jgi:hypothetical protein